MTPENQPTAQEIADAIREADEKLIKLLEEDPDGGT